MSQSFQPTMGNPQQIPATTLLRQAETPDRIKSCTEQRRRRSQTSAGPRIPSISKVTGVPSRFLRRALSDSGAPRPKTASRTGPTFFAAAETMRAVLCGQTGDVVEPQTETRRFSNHSLWWAARVGNLGHAAADGDQAEFSSLHSLRETRASKMLAGHKWISRSFLSTAA